LSFALQKLLGRKAAVFPTATISGEELARKEQPWRPDANQVAMGMMKMSPRDEFKEVASSNQHRAEPVEIWKARRFIEEHSGEELSLRKVAKAVSISANHMSDKFKQVTGVNFVDFVAHVRFEKACNLLLNSNLRISEIAFAVGFQSLSQFNRVFRKLSGQSPTEFRSEHLRRTQRR
jgi:AraC-like DNA-binding protein